VIGVPDSSTDLVLEVTDAAGLHQLREPLMDVYRDAYADKLDHPFFTEARMWERLEAYATRDGFTLVLAYEGGELVGYALGNTFMAGSRWGQGMITDVAPALLVEDGKRTFGFNYIMVRHTYRRRGIAKALHDKLIASRHEVRACLLVLPENVAARSAYLTWGWYKIGDLRPFDDAPVYDAMLLDLKH
jgi:GNAT superfamily N-acetyltransferase